MQTAKRHITVHSNCSKRYAAVCKRSQPLHTTTETNLAVTAKVRRLFTQNVPANFFFSVFDLTITVSEVLITSTAHMTYIYIHIYAYDDVSTKFAYVPTYTGEYVHYVH